MAAGATLLRGGRVLVGDERMPRAADVLVAGGRIAGVGGPGAFDDAGARGSDVFEASGARGSAVLDASGATGLDTGLDVVELDGRVVLPGFVDGHCHLELAAVALDSHLAVHAPPFDSIPAILERLAQARAARPEGWIIARSSFGLQHKVAEGRLPHRDELDRVSPAQPIVLLAGLHVACLNSAAIRELGLDDLAALPPSISVHCDAAGPTGVFTEVWDRLPTAPVDDVVAALQRHAGRLFTRNGVTSLSTIPTSAADVRALHRMARDRALPFRARFYTHVPRTATIDEVLSWGPESGFGDELLRFGGVKIFVDGEGADAMGTPRDDTKWTRAELTELVDRADAAGIQVMMHAVTPAAVRLACDAVASARRRRAVTERTRHRIEHGGDYIDAKDAGLARDAGVGLVATPHFASSSDPAARDFQPLRTLIDAGHPLIGASDATGTVPDAVGPLANIAAAVTRLAPDGRPSPHRITVLEGIRMFTSWSAYGAGEEQEVGRIAPGLRADLVVLDDDPFTVPAERIGGIGVDRTILGGRTMAVAA